MKIHYSIFASLLVAALTASQTIAADHEHQHPHDNEHRHAHSQHTQTAHEHGVAQMSLTIVKNDVLIEVTSPLYNVIGFEHKPKNDEQRINFKQQIKVINNAKLVQLNNSAQCSLVEVNLVNPFHHPDRHDEMHHQHNDKHNHDHKHGNHMHSTHKDMSFEYQLHCDAPEKITTVNAEALFKAWPNLKNLRTEWIFQNKQSAANLTPENTSVNFD